MNNNYYPQEYERQSQCHQPIMVQSKTSSIIWWFIGLVIVGFGILALMSYATGATKAGGQVNLLSPFSPSNQVSIVTHDKVYGDITAIAGNNNTLSTQPNQKDSPDFFGLIVLFIVGAIIIFGIIPKIAGDTL